eukprot:3438132-Pyramimonas_sp.AAC.1
MRLPAPNSCTLDWLPSNDSQVMAPPGESRATPSCLSTPLGVIGARHRRSDAPQECRCSLPRRSVVSS